MSYRPMLSPIEEKKTINDHLAAAAAVGSVTAVEYYLLHRASLFPMYEASFGCAFRAAARTGQVTMIRRLLERLDYEINEIYQNSDARSLLLEMGQTLESNHLCRALDAAAPSRFRAVHLIIEHGVPIDSAVVSMCEDVSRQLLASPFEPHGDLPLPGSVKLVTDKTMSVIFLASETKKHLSIHEIRTEKYSRPGYNWGPRCLANLMQEVASGKRRVPNEPLPFRQLA
ncbi:hypothetical protein CC86DRAFT_402754 [Ophiobolus disseminans]|uniref:Uncharacterized protein n=1 Tax=Ophiobolus disseminans TaxID=1469910 RepID=A0A6A7ADR5_9PLEO|nr:hypothetical protein CC86DRAFT_402754 [Ophiobolus disseminans]